MNTSGEDSVPVYVRDIPSTASRYDFARPRPVSAAARLVLGRGGTPELQLNVDDVVFDLRLDWRVLSEALIEARRIAKEVGR